jgi:TRAP-type C4-dicarboxylate transport system permease small subunit
LVKGHVVLDLLTMKFKPGAKKFWLFVTRILGVFLFTFMGYELISMAIDLKRSGEVSATLKLPFYPVAFGIGLCLFLQVLTLIIDAVSAIKEEKK